MINSEMNRGEEVYKYLLIINKIKDLNCEISNNTILETATS
jgi:hypothetical protein